MQSASTKPQKVYEEPSLKKVSPAQAKEFLLYHAKMGDQGAKDILKLVLPNSDGS
jgi:hypothetical protein